jgi:hypothetical protein
MLVELDLPFVDARAADLTLVLGASPQLGLGSLELEAAGAKAELRLLGFSHQALVHADDYELSELVACRPGESDPLPARADHSLGQRRYQFKAQMSSFSPSGYAEIAASLKDQLAARPDSLIGVFPGPEGAFTALKLWWRRSVLSWETWHGYPQSCELVYTASRIGS